MRTLLLLLFILTIGLPNQKTANSDKDSSVEVVSAKRSKSRLTTEQAQANSTNVAPASAVSQAGESTIAGLTLLPGSDIRMPTPPTSGLPNSKGACKSRVRPSLKR